MIRQKPRIEYAVSALSGQNFWLWVFFNAAPTDYHINPQRSSAVVKGVLGEPFAGILISDFFRAYGPLEATQQKCNAHLLAVNVETWPEAARIQQRLRKHHSEILLFLSREEVPFDVTFDHYLNYG